MFLLTQIILALTLFGNLALLFFLIRGKQTTTLRVFTTYVVAVTLWTGSIFINLWLESLFVERIIFASAALFLVTELWFVLLFPNKVLPKQWWRYWSVIPALGLIVISFIPNTLFTTISIHEQGYTILDAGPYSSTYSLLAFIYMWTPVFILLVRWLREKEEDLRKQFKALFIGFFLFVAVNIFTNSVLPVFFGIFIFNAIGPVFSLALAAFIFYLIRKQELFEIRRTIQRGVTYSLTFGLVIALYAGLLFFVQQKVSTALAAPLSAFILLVIGIYTIPFIERLFIKWTDKIFFKDSYDYPKTLEELSAILHTSIDFTELITNIEKTLAHTLRASDVRIVLQDTACALEHVSLQESISLNGEIIGHIVVCEKKSGDPYTSEDVRLLTTFAYHAATALGRARLFQELENKVEERTAEIQSLQENQSQMMLDIAHGLQTPLAVFKNKLEQTDGAENLNRPLMDLSHFIDDLLKLARLEQQDSKTEEVSLSKMLEEIAEEVTTIAAADDVSVEQAIEQEIVISGNSVELREAIMNLASNALKYIGDEKKKVSFELFSNAESIQLRVSDTGVGIEESDLPHVFDRFYRVKGSSETGNGLGLAITKRIIEKHGGSITVHSTPGQGSVFTITFSS